MLEGQTSETPSGAKEYMSDAKMVGGFAFVAYPAQYGNSGVMTFMMNQDGVLLEKDLGKTTAESNVHERVRSRSEREHCGGMIEAFGPHAGGHSLKSR